MVKKIILLICLFLYANTFSQINAVTETGEPVILYKNNTWKYANKEDKKEKKEVLTNDFKFTRDKGATFLVKSKKMPIGFWINPKKWSFERSNSNEASEFSFTLKDADLYAMAITERIEIPLANLKKIAVSNAREVAPDVSVDKEEYRWVNGKKILMMQLSGTTEGVKFVYYAYYYSSKKGVVQLVTYSSSSLFEEYKKEMELFLNGFVETE